MKQIIYLGPTIPRLVKSGTVFKDMLPRRVEERAKNDKSFSRLLVPIDKAPRIAKQLQTEGSAEYVAYISLERSINE